MRVVTVMDATHETVIGTQIRVADTSLSRIVGLLGKRGLDAGEGLWIRPSSGVHTFGMKFPIDVLGLDKNLKVIQLWPRLVPWRMTSIRFRLRSVVELSAGQIEQCRVQLGDSLKIVG